MKNFAWASYNYYDATIALNYFDMAMKASNDPEMKAKALYMKAKVEKTKSFSYDYWSGPEDVDNNDYWDCLKQLKTEFSNTQYYKEILRECYDFRAYLNQ